MTMPVALPLTPEQRCAQALQDELIAIEERRAQAKATNRAAIALFRELAATPGVRIGRVQGRDASGRFADDDAE